MTSTSASLDVGRQDHQRVPLLRPELRIALVYIVLASLWVVYSDLALDLWAKDPPDTAQLQTAKGLNFVITTAVLLFFVLRKAYRGWRGAEEQRRRVSEQARRKLRALSARLQALREEERAHISREIHDELGQMLTGLKMELSWIERRISERNDRELNLVLDKLVETTELVDTTLSKVRHISTELRPGALDTLGLPAALEEEALRFQERSGVPCTVDCAADLPSLPQDVTTAAFRIFQESLTNVARHAHAKSVNADCRVTQDHLRLCVEDDGKGLHPAELEDRKSLGLLGMRERAALLGGEVSFTRGDKGGTRVEAVLPLASSDTVLLYHQL